MNRPGRPLRFRPWPLLVTAVGALLLCAKAAQAEGPVVGSKKFTESVILGEIVLASLSTAPGETPQHRRELGGTQVLYKALLRGDIDVYPEYTGTISAEVLSEPGLSLSVIKQRLADVGVEVTEPLGFDNTYALGMRKTRASQLGLATISQLQSHPELQLGLTAEFMERADGWPGLRARYGLAMRGVRGMDHDLAYRGLSSGTLDVIDLYSTDAEIAYYDLSVLEDDRGYFPRYDAVLVYRADLSPAHKAQLSTLVGQLDETEMRRMNAAVKLHGEREQAVARRFLAQHDIAMGRAVATEGLLQALGRTTAEHVSLVAVSLLAGIALAIPLGVLAARRRRLSQLVLGVSSVLQTVPSLAMLVIMIPLLGIGAPPAIATLFLYSLLPIVRNTYAGLVNIDPRLLESADALGLSRSARLRLVEFPLALPTVLAGIKTAAVINVGTATLGALVGAGGYGQPILTGIRLDDTALILQGAVPSAALALLVQAAFDTMERRLVRPR